MMITLRQENWFGETANPGWWNLYGVRKNQKSLGSSGVACERLDPWPEYLSLSFFSTPSSLQGCNAYQSGMTIVRLKWEGVCEG